MKLKEYLTKINQKPIPWARSNGLSEATVWRIYNGKRASPRVAMLITRATKGQVRVMETIYQ